MAIPFDDRSIDYNVPPAEINNRSPAMSPRSVRSYPFFRVTLIVLGAAALLVVFSRDADSQRKEAATPTIDGTRVEWEGWKFNWLLRPVEGLVLTDVYFRGRKVLNYAGIAELLTVYDQ